MAGCLKKLPPFIPFTIAFIVGIACDRLFKPDWVWVLIPICTGVILMFRRPKGVLLLALALGLLVHHLHRAPYSSFHVRNIFAEKPAYLECEGWVMGVPVLKVLKHGTQLEFPLKLKSYQEGGNWKKIGGSVLVRWKRDSASDTISPPLSLGDQVRVVGYLNPSQVSTNPYVFDYRNYLETRGLFYELDVEPDDPPIERLTGFGPACQLFALKGRLEEAVLRGIQDSADVQGLILGMILGERSQIDPIINENFRQTGTLHVIAISGLHITLIAFLIAFVLRLFQLPRSVVTGIVIPLLAGYVIMTGFSSSAVRSLIMCTVFMVGWMFNRPAHMMNTVAVSAFLILIVAPYQLFDAGFQLSFLVVTAIVLLTPRITGRLEPWVSVDPFLAHEFVSPWQRRMSRGARWMVELFSVSLAAWIGSVGLIAYYFHLVSPVSLFCNLIVVPLSSLSLGLGFAAMFLDFIWPGLVVLLNQAHWLVIKTMLWMTEVGSSWSWGYSYVPHPGPWLVILGYVVLGVALAWKKARWWIAGGAMMSIVIGLGCVVAWGLTTITVLDVKSGQAIFIEKAFGPKILIDSGSEFQGRSIILPFLRARGVNSLDAVIATHGDASHVGGLMVVIKEMPVGGLVVSAAKARSPKYKKLLKMAAEINIPIVEVKTGDVFRCGSLEMEALWPLPPFQKNADGNCLVLRYKDLLFMSDLPLAFEDQLGGEGGWTVIRGVKGHELFSDGFLRRTHRAIFSCSDRYQDDMIFPATLSRLEEQRIPYWLTGLHGAISIKDTSKGMLIEPRFASPQEIQ